MRLTLTVDSPRSSSATVRLTPFKATNPFASTYGIHFLGTVAVTKRRPAAASIATTSQVAAMCPDNTLPPISSPMRKERSTFTASPTHKAPRLVARRVSATRSKAAFSPRTAVVVRQTPLMATDAPGRKPSA